MFSSVRVGDVVEEGQQPVIVVLGNRVFLVVVAAGAVDRQPQEHLAGGGDDVVEPVVPGQRAIGGLVVPEAQPIEAGGDECLGRARIDLVAGELLAGRTGRKACPG